MSKSSNELEKEVVNELEQMFKKFPLENGKYLDCSILDLNSKIRFLIDSFLLEKGLETPKRE